MATYRRRINHSADVVTVFVRCLKDWECDEYTVSKGVVCEVEERIAHAAMEQGYLEPYSAEYDTRKVERRTTKKAAAKTATE